LSSPAVRWRDLGLERRRAWEEGYRQGRKAALAEARKGLSRSLPRLVREAEENWRRREERLRAEFLAILASLGRALAERILERELSLHPDEVVRMAERLLEEAGRGGRILFRCHPGEAFLLEEALGDAAEILEDGAVAPGGLILETPRGIWDARLEVQLERLERVVEEVLGQGED